MGDRHTMAPVTESGNTIVKDDIPGIQPVHNGLVVNDVHIQDPDNPDPARVLLGRCLEQELAHHPGTPDKPTVVLFGELHNTAAHHLLQASAVNHITSCRNRRDSGLIFACERMYDSLQNMANLHLLRVPKRLYWQLNAFDPDGKAALTALCSDLPDHPERPGKRHLFKTLLNGNIPTLFSDAARAKPRNMQKQIINPEDPMMHMAWTACANENRLSRPDTGVYAITEPDGLTLRNWMMRERAMTYAFENGASVIFQNCGRGHVFGESGIGEYQNSLAALYNKAGCHVLPVLFVNDTDDVRPEHTIERTAFENHPETVILRGTRSPETNNAPGLAGYSAYRDDLTGQSIVNGEYIRQQNAREQLQSVIHEAKRHNPGFPEKLRRGLSGITTSGPG